MAIASCVTIATTAAVTAEARGGVPFAERSTAFIAAGEQIGGGAALHRKGLEWHVFVFVVTVTSFYFEDP